MRDFYDANKGALKMAGLMIIITIVIVVVTGIMTNKSETKTPKEALNSIARLYYENRIYPTIEEMSLEAKQLTYDNYSKTGIKISLRTFLENVTDINADVFFNAKKKTNCDVDYTYVEIYPVYPYTKSDYKVEVTTDCKLNFANTDKATEDEQTNYSGYETE